MVHFKRDSETPEVSLTISLQTFFRLAILVAASFVIWHAIHKAQHAILLVFSAFFLTLALNQPVYWLSRRIPGKRKGSRAIATTLSYLFVILILGGFIASIVSPLIHQTENLISAAPHLVSNFKDNKGEVGKLVRHYHLQKQVSNLSSQLSSRLKDVGGAAFGTVEKIGSSIFSLLTILVLTFMMLVEGPRWVNFFRNLVPKRHAEMTDRMLADMYKVIRGFVNGQVTLAALASVLIMPAVFILGIGYPAAIVVIIFVCGLIPMVGHTIGAVIVTVIALFHSTSSAVIILAYYILYQQIENYLIQPRIQANSTNMSPLLVFMSVVLGVSFGGLFGGLVAIPVAGCLRIVLLEYLRSQHLINTPEFNTETTQADPMGTK